jgi:hypothetical protein
MEDEKQIIYEISELIKKLSNEKYNLIRIRMICEMILNILDDKN